MDPTTVNELTAAFIQGMRYLGAGLAMIGAAGAGVGVGLAAMGGVQAMGRNPDVTSTLQVNMILGIVFAEAIAIYAMAVALIVLFV
jgi:F0F1-type ATP synthase membrane subunit c/vacuolar-type H+-ATPase subunit K